MFNRLIHQINRQTAGRFDYRGRVIDLGCGTCPYREVILSKARAYIGVDWPGSLHDGRKVDVFANLTADLPFRDGSADTITSFQVMEHLPEPARFLSESFRLLKPGGCIFLTLPFMWHVHEEPHDYFRYTRYGLEYLLGKSGFTDIVVEECTGFWQMWVLKFNYHSVRYARGPLKWLLAPVWWLGQKLSPILDRFDRHPEETASYAVSARKPGEPPNHPVIPHPISPGPQNI